MLDRILYLVEAGKVPHTLLFAGPEGAGKRSAALKLAEALLKAPCENHPDLHIYLPDSSGGMHTIEAMRAFINEVHIAPYKAPAKVFIFEEADRMLASSSNALLKTLEEPALNCYIILLSTRPEAILPTILSRAQTFTFAGGKKESLERTEKRDLLVKLLSQKLPYAEQMKALTTFNEEEHPEKILEEILHWYRDRHLLVQGIELTKLHFSVYQEELQKCTLALLPLEQIFDQIEDARFALQQHVALRHCLDKLLAYTTI